MNGDTPSDSEKRSGFNPAQSISTLADLQVKAYENRVRERLLAKYPTLTPAKARRLEKEIEKIIRFMLRDEISCRMFHRMASAEITGPKAITPTRDNGISHERQ